MRTVSLVLATLAATVAAAPARAQIGLSPVQDYIDKTTLLNGILSNGRAVGMSQRAQREAAAGAGSAAGTATAPTEFRAAPRSLLPRRLAGRTAGDADRQRAAEAAFESLLDLYRRTAATDGFPANDVAYALEYAVVNGYMTYHDLHDVPHDRDPRVQRGASPLDRLALAAEKRALRPTPTQERAVYAQLRRELAANDAVRRMTDAEKQELAEALAIGFGTTYTAYMRGVATGDGALMAQARRAAGEHLERLTGAPVASLRIDEGGLRRR